MRACTSLACMPRSRTTRSIAISGSTSTTITPESPFRGDSVNNGKSRIAIASVSRSSLMSRSISTPIAGCTILLRSASACASENTSEAIFARSSSPSAPTTSPKRSTISAKTSVPERCKARAMASPSIMIAPRSANICETVDLPEPMPPVRPTRIMNYMLSGDGQRCGTTSDQTAEVSPAGASSACAAGSVAVAAAVGALESKYSDHAASRVESSPPTQLPWSSTWN